MTSGTRAYGDKPVSNIYSTWAGYDHFCYDKTWSGGDMPKLPQPQKMYRYVSRVIRYKTKKRWWGDKDKARRVWVTKTIVVKIRVNRPFWDPKPRRRSQELHAYSMQIHKRSQERREYMNGDDAWNGAPRPPIVTDSCSLEGGSGYLSSGQGMQFMDWSSNDDIKLLNRLIDKIKGTDFNASVFLGEGHQTLGLIADSAIRIRKALTHLHRGDIAGTARSLLEGTSRKPLKPYATMGHVSKASPKVLANNWLELIYGWLPLLNDAHDAAEQLAHYLSEPLERCYKASLKKAYEGKTLMYVGNTTTGKSPNTTDVYRFFDSYYTSSRIDRLSIYIKEKPDAIAQLGLKNPLPVAWELTPWSFVVDWFIPIGQYLEARGLTSLVPGIYQKSTLSQGRNTPPAYWSNSNGAVPPGKAAYRRELPNRVKWSPPGGSDTDGESNRAHSKYVFYIRGAPTSEPPSVPLPSFKPLSKAASWIHCTNAVALLVQQFGSSSETGRTAALPDIRKR